MKPSDKSRPWKACTAAERLDACRMMLVMHGFLSDAENTKVKARLTRWQKTHKYGNAISSTERSLS